MCVWGGAKCTCTAIIALKTEKNENISKKGLHSTISVFPRRAFFVKPEGIDVIFTYYHFADFGKIVKISFFLLN